MDENELTQILGKVMDENELTQILGEMAGFDSSRDFDVSNGSTCQTCQTFKHLLNIEFIGFWLEKQMEFPQVPDTFRSLGSPWRVSDGVSQSETINKVLERSLEVQASRFAASTEFYRNASSHLPKDYVCTSTNSCIEISGLLQYYFSRLGIDAKVFCGSIQPSPFPFLHTFLEIDGEIIDNTYVYNILRPEVRLHK